MTIQILRCMLLSLMLLLAEATAFSPSFLFSSSKEHCPPESESSLEQEQVEGEETLVTSTVVTSIHTSIDDNTGISPPPQKHLALASKTRVGQTAMILNLNARSVSLEIAELAKTVFGEDNVFVTTTVEEAQQAVATIVKDQYSLVVPVGGDGTLSSTIDLMCDQIIMATKDTSVPDNTDQIISLEEAMRYLPLMGYIPLGTGNGVGSVVGCRVTSGGFLPGRKRRKLKQLKLIMERFKLAGQQQRKDSDSISGSITSNTTEYFQILELPMIEVAQHSKDLDQQHAHKKGDLCFFAGVGFDSLMLNDFKNIKAWSKRTGVLTKMLSSVMGYCVALVIKTLPKCIFEGGHNIEVKITSGDNDTFWVDHRRGDFVRRVSEKELYSGAAGILAAGTSPFYGGGLRLFPFARMTTDKMHLRVGRIHPMVGFLNLPQIFAGSYRDTSDRFGCIDFIGADFEVEVTGGGQSNDKQGENQGFPFQHSGEMMGHVERFRLRVVKQPVRFVEI